MQKEREDSTLWVEMTSFNATAESHNHTRLLLATCSLGLDSAELSNTQQHTNNTGHTPAARESGKIPASHDRSTVLFLNKKLNLPWPPKALIPSPSSFQEVFSLDQVTQHPPFSVLESSSIHDMYSWVCVGGGHTCRDPIRWCWTGGCFFTGLW